MRGSRSDEKKVDKKIFALWGRAARAHALGERPRRDTLSHRFLA
jgi:hypothetical protein